MEEPGSFECLIQSLTLLSRLSVMKRYPGFPNIISRTFADSNSENRKPSSFRGQKIENSEPSPS